MEIKKIEKPLKLTNKGNLELFFIGTGTAFSKALYNNNLFIIKGDTHILVDFGSTGPLALSKTTGLTVDSIKTILPTHSHADHIGGFEYLALFHRYVTEPRFKVPKLKMIVSSQYEKILWDRSLRGGMEWNESNSSGHKLQFNDYFDTIHPTLVSSITRDIFTIDYEGIHLEMFTTNHIPDNAISQKQAFITFGLFIDNKVFFSGDTKFDIELINNYAPKSEYMFHDCSFFPNPVHSSLQELRTLPKEIKEKMYLMHYGDNFEEQDVSDFAGYAQQGCRHIFK